MAILLPLPELRLYMCITISDKDCDLLNITLETSSQYASQLTKTYKPHACQNVHFYLGSFLWKVMRINSVCQQTWSINVISYLKKGHTFEINKKMYAFQPTVKGQYFQVLHFKERIPMRHNQYVSAKNTFSLEGHLSLYTGRKKQCRPSNGPVICQMAWGWRHTPKRWSLECSAFPATTAGEGRHVMYPYSDYDHTNLHLPTASHLTVLFLRFELVCVTTRDNSSLCFLASSLLCHVLRWQDHTHWNDYAGRKAPLWDMLRNCFQNYRVLCCAVQTRLIIPSRHKAFHVSNLNLMSAF